MFCQNSIAIRLEWWCDGIGIEWRKSNAIAWSQSRSLSSTVSATANLLWPEIPLLHILLWYKIDCSNYYISENRIWIHHHLRCDVSWQCSSWCDSESKCTAANWRSIARCSKYAFQYFDISLIDWNLIDLIDWIVFVVTKLTTVGRSVHVKKNYDFLNLNLTIIILKKGFGCSHINSSKYWLFFEKKIT